jgi:hypothetical protein
MKKFYVKKATLIPVVFVHIQKTAGSSIVALAREHYGHSVISHGDFSGHRPEDFQDIAFISGHFGYEFARPLLSKRYSFTFLRNPIERVLSFYYYCKGQNPNELEIYSLAQQLSLEEFLNHSQKNNLHRTAVCNNQAWQLAYGFGHGTDRGYFSFEEQEMQELAISHLKNFSHIGFTETFEADRNIILKKLGIPRPRENVITNASGNNPAVQELPDSTVALLRKATHIDQILYDHAWFNRNSLHLF